MATITWERNQNTIPSPTWVDIGSNTLVFSGSATDLTVPIGTTSWNDGFHIGSNDPGSDQCGGGPNSSHNNCVKFLTTGTMSVNGGGSEAINDTNLAEAECTLRIHLNNATAVQTQNTYFFCFDGATDTVEAVGVEAYAFERGVSATAWTFSRKTVSFDFRPSQGSLAVACSCARTRSTATAPTDSSRNGT